LYLSRVWILEDTSASVIASCIGFASQATMSRGQALPGMFGAFALTSFATSIAMLVKPEAAWRLYGVRSEQRSLSSICYASAVFGEGCLQACAAAFPGAFLGPAIVFMVPYKLVSGLALFIHSLYVDPVQKREARWIALQWLAPIALIFAAIRVDGTRPVILDA
jgi:hypothetical protein